MVQVLEMIWMLNELIQANENFFMNFKYIEHWGPSFWDDIDAKKELFQTYQMVIQCILIINRRIVA